MALSEVSAENFVSSIRFDTCITLAAFTLLYYDYALTVTSEIEWYWSPPSPSAPFILFTVSRYFGLLGPIPVFLEYFGGLPEHVTVRETLWRNSGWISSRFGPLDVAKYKSTTKLLLILRTYALYNCNKRVLALLICMFIGGAVQSVSAVMTSDSPLSTDIPLNFPFMECNLSLNVNQGVHLALAWSAMLWFDTSIFALTFYKAIQVRHDMPGTLLVTMFRDGTIYYGILIVVNTLNIITFLIVPSGDPLKGTATTLTNVLSVTLTSRLMLNLRDPSIQVRRTRGGCTQRLEWWSTAQFSSKIMSFRRSTMFSDTMVTEEPRVGLTEECMGIEGA
ncbi:hypothetical protein GSI_13882 [Ganoderma sinense ZZ0214-1]|uniref:DUF6533 domain-containing protein n=1 Tax=Ganoderma sinense ZZ0214-1 TaxID=1077348 RepID=A0A2G8RRJ0_9APHY|nr:hypothetical protein GSI_13882 [Ganoderma sinense ZZ0214-1]